MDRFRLITQKLLSANYKNGIIIVSLSITIISPIFIYVSIFNDGISHDHSRWAEFGSAIGGIYAPIVGGLTLFVLFRQVGLQEQVNDQYYLQQAREDIEFYASQLSTILDQALVDDVSLRAVLHERFILCNAENLCSEEMKDIAIDIHRVIPQSIDMWSAIYPILIGLSALDSAQFKMTLSSSKQKLIALLGIGMCVALDHLHFSRSHETCDFDYIFSPYLNGPDEQSVK